MAKGHICLSIDNDLIDEVRALNVKISPTVEEFLRTLVSKSNDDVNGINIALEQIKADKLIKKIGAKQAELKQIQDKIQHFAEKQQQKREKILEKEKKELEAKSNCFNCGGHALDNSKTFPIGKICNSCFMNATGDSIRKWNVTK